MLSTGGSKSSNRQRATRIGSAYSPRTAGFAFWLRGAMARYSGVNSQDIEVIGYVRALELNEQLSANTGCRARAGTCGQGGEIE